MKRKKPLALLLTAALLTAMSGCVGNVTYLDGNGNATNPPAQSGAEVSSQESTENQESTPDENSDQASADTVSFGLCDKIEDGVILHAWSWSFNTIKESMADIAAAGYSTIQTSPANKVTDGGGGMQLMGRGKWYYQYQPINWTIGNYQMGTEEEFKEMCNEADKYGIKIIVDVVPNHTAADKSTVEQSFIDAVGGADKLYHKGASEGITSYSDRLNVTTHSLTGLWDVNTENPLFQEYFINYLNQLIADGADGFRYDTAKHIALPDDPQEDPNLPNNFWEQVTTKIDKADTIFNYGEVLQGDKERIDAYLTAIGHTTASNYGAALRGAVKRGKMNLKDLSGFMAADSDNVVTWVESHDNYTGGDSNRMTDQQILLGWAVIAANGKGTPLFYDRPYGSSPDEQWGTMNRIGAAGSELYKNETVVALNRFRNALVGEETVMTNPQDNKAMLMIARGNKGAVIVNSGADDVELSVDTALADGTYTDRGKQNGDFNVSGGKLSGTVKGGTVAVLYNEGYTEPVQMAEVSVDTDSFNISGSEKTVTLKLSGADSGEYTLNGATESFTDGQTLSITADSNGEAVLKLSAKNASGLTSNMTYWFTQISSVPSGSSISFTKPASWGNKIYAYVYDETASPAASNAEWPGAEMTADGDVYTYVTTQDWTGALVIFNDGGTNQYPPSLEPGFELEAGKTYAAETSGDTKPAEESSEEEKTSDNAQDIKITFTKPEKWGDDVCAYVYGDGDAKNAEWPGVAMTNNGDGTYSYEVPSDIANAKIIFNYNGGKRQYPRSQGLDVKDSENYTAE